MFRLCNVVQFLLHDQQESAALPVAVPLDLALGYLLARPGIEVLVLKKHADFLSQADRSRP